MGRRKLDFSELDLRNMEALYAEQGLSTYEIAELYGCLSGSIHRRLVKRGVEMRAIGERHPNREPKRWETEHGYIRISGDRYEHRVVAEQNLGRKLRDGETVHHLNGDKTDNRWENLEVLTSQSEHMYEHEDDVRQWTREADAVLAWCRDHGISMTRIAKLLGVTYGSVTGRASTLTRRGRLEPVKPGRKPGGPPPIPAWLKQLCDDMKRLDAVQTGNQDASVIARYGRVSRV